MRTTPVRVWAWRGKFAARVPLVAIVVLVSFSATAANVLFPQPLHLTRTIEDPISQKTSVVHEYCAGNRVVTLSGDRVAIADYARQELTEIDRAAGTYSVTSFADLAAAAPAAPRRTLAANAQSAPQSPRWKSAALGARSSSRGRTMDAYELTIETPEESVRLEIGVDRGVRLSREAVEVLIGASFPNPRNDAHDAILDTARAADTTPRATVTTQTSAQTPAGGDYGLPVEQITTWELGHERLTVRNAIVDVRHDLPPAELLAIPPGATRVESRAIRLARELRELDRLPASPQQSQ